MSTLEEVGSPKGMVMEPIVDEEKGHEGWCKCR
jgi:hypothetical protein